MYICIYIYIYMPIVAFFIRLPTPISSREALACLVCKWIIHVHRERVKWCIWIHYSPSTSEVCLTREWLYSHVTLSFMCSVSIKREERNPFGFPSHSAHIIHVCPRRASLFLSLLVNHHRLSWVGLLVVSSASLFVLSYQQSKSSGSTFTLP